MSAPDLFGWDRLSHGGLLLDPARLRRIGEQVPEPLLPTYEEMLRRRASALLADRADRSEVSEFVAFVLQSICGFTSELGIWARGPQVGSDWGRSDLVGETVKPRLLWRGLKGGVLPVFLDTEERGGGGRIGIGRGRKKTSQVLQWLRAGHEKLALLTNGRQWRLIYAGLDFDAWCEWNLDLWFEEGTLSPQVTALRTLLSPRLWVPELKDGPAPLLQAIQDSRKGQAELSAILGERVREAVEILIQAHAASLTERCADVVPSEIYRAAVRVVMRMVVILFGESRELLPRTNALYHGSYGLSGLLEELERIAARGGGGRLARSSSAWPRILGLFRLVYSGSHHPSLPVPAYGGDLFAPASSDTTEGWRDGLTRALHVLEDDCFDASRAVISDGDVHRMLERLTRTRVKVRQGSGTISVPSPVDFTDLSSEYIGILYEGLLDFELKTAPPDEPVVFLAVGNQPALPLSRLEAMDEKAIKNLLEKMKDTSKEEDTEGGDEEVATEEGATAVTEEVAGGDEPEEPGDATEPEVVDAGDHRRTTRTRAETWARRAALAAGLVSKLRGKPTPEKELVQEERLGRKARQLVTRVVLPGERYLVRWGGTRKGSGTFYTRPGLAVPTVQRTLRSLAYTPPVGPDGKPNLDAPAATWMPRRPEEILALKVCDPGCGSGTFPVAALRFLTDALYDSLHRHQRLLSDGDRTLLGLLAIPKSEAQSGEPTAESLASEFLPCRPDDQNFESRLKALLRRHVVERCLYGVDLDPLAVELCRLALWIETMDRSLPFSFLDHKIKCGNALVGAWFDQFQHYPVMAWKNREGGDKSHSNGVHYQKDARGKAIKEFAKQLGTDLADVLIKQGRMFEAVGPSPETVLAAARTTLSRLHDLPVSESAERGRLYRQEFLGSEGYRKLKEAMDLWCAGWFWPADELASAPMPSKFGAPAGKTREMAAKVAAAKRFFHWELEFPDVFRASGAGFDAILGNPPWDIAKPNSKEFFSNIDPLYRSYGKQEALARQTELFAEADIERSWIDYNADLRAQSNFMGQVASPFGDPKGPIEDGDRFSIVRGKQNDGLHERWRSARANTTGFADPAHSFRHQGSADLNLYKLFLEQAHALLRSDGRLGFIVPSGLYSDYGTGGLRALFLDRCRWEWLFGFENRDKVFEIDSRFKFNPIVVQKGGRTDAIRTAFMRRRLEDWERGEEFAFTFLVSDLRAMSPKSLVLLEFESPVALELARTVTMQSRRLEDHLTSSGEAAIRYIHHEFFATADSKLFPPRDRWTEDGYKATDYGHWVGGDGRRAIPVVEGRMIDFYDFSAKGWISGKGRTAQWADLGWNTKEVQPQYLIAEPDYVNKPEVFPGWKVTLMDVTSATNARTVISTAGSGLATIDSCRNLVAHGGKLIPTLLLTQLLNCVAFDWLARYRVGGLHVTWFQLAEMVAPSVDQLGSPRIPFDVFRLCAAHLRYAPDWIRAEVQFRGVPIASSNWKQLWAATPTERTRLRVQLDAIAIARFGLTDRDLRYVLRDCDHPASLLAMRGGTTTLSPKGFWRVDKDKDPELRHTVLTLVAFHDLQQKTTACGGDRDQGIADFLGQNGGEGWLLPETLRLADYGLGQDDRAQQPQPVRSRLGPRFYDWQLAQSAEESWRECHLHARNLLGEEGYQRLLREACEGSSGHDVPPTKSATPKEKSEVRSPQRPLFG